MNNLFGFRAAEPKDLRYTAAVAGWSAQESEPGPAGLAAVIRLQREDTAEEAEWSIHACSMSRYQAQKYAEKFFWELLRIARSAVMNKFGKKIWRTPMTWISSGTSSFFVRANSLAQAAATQPLHLEKSLLVSPSDSADQDHYRLQIECIETFDRRYGMAIGLSRNGRIATWCGHRCRGTLNDVRSEAETFAHRYVRPPFSVEYVTSGDRVIALAKQGADSPLLTAGIPPYRRVR